MEKHNEYATKLLSAIQSVFDEESENYINLDELKEGHNLTHFIHAAANLAPAIIYCKFANQDVSSLEFNHIANKLCFQFSNLVKSDESEVTND